jgi:hypothetical protein
MGDMSSTSGNWRQRSDDGASAGDDDALSAVGSSTGQGSGIRRAPTVASSDSGWGSVMPYDEFN